MNAQQSDNIRVVLIPFFEGIILWFSFWIAYNLRTMTDGIPFVQLKIPYISVEQFLPFVLTGILIWYLVFWRAGLYSHRKKPIFEEIRRVLVYGFFWFVSFIGVVYLTQGFIFFKEIPRLIIIYTLIFGVIFSILFRIFVHFLWKFLQKKQIFKRQTILVIRENNNEKLPFDIDFSEANYEILNMYEVNSIENMVRSGKIQSILVVSSHIFEKKFEPILHLARIYGIKCVYPQIMPNMQNFSREETFLAGIPVFSLSAVRMTPWQMVFKRCFDIIFSIIFIVITLPIMIIAYIGIKIEDPKGPAIYRNRRIGQNGKVFSLFKFRYMYWKYCTKEDYLKNNEKDDALEFEEKLKAKSNSRGGPLYKIKNDPRKMRFGGILEKLSIDELPQLFNVLYGNMSLVGPRPHQPREVALYDESDKQVLTIKPGITGMAQVYGRDNNTFKEEVAHDVYYIENYSILLDFMIIIRTVGVVLIRPFEKK